MFPTVGGGETNVSLHMNVAVSTSTVRRNSLPTTIRYISAQGLHMHLMHMPLGQTAAPLALRGSCFGLFRAPRLRVTDRHAFITTCFTEVNHDHNPCHRDNWRCCVLHVPGGGFFKMGGFFTALPNIRQKRVNYILRLS